MRYKGGHENISLERQKRWNLIVFVQIYLNETNKQKKPLKLAGKSKHDKKKDFVLTQINYKVESWTMQIFCWDYTITEFLKRIDWPFDHW